MSIADDVPDATRPPSVVTFGETMGLFYSTDPGPLGHVGTARLGIGGAESNVAIALQRLGSPTAHREAETAKAHRG